MRKSLELGGVDLEGVPGPANFHLISCLGQSHPPPALCVGSFSASPLHASLSLSLFFFPNQYIFLLQKFLLNLREAVRTNGSQTESLCYTPESNTTL